MMEPVRTWRERIIETKGKLREVTIRRYTPNADVMTAMEEEITELRALLAEAICEDDEELASHVHIAAIFSVGKPNPDAEVLFQAAQRIRQLANIVTSYENILGVLPSCPSSTQKPSES